MDRVGTVEEYVGSESDEEETDQHRRWGGAADAGANPGEQEGYPREKQGEGARAIGTGGGASGGVSGEQCVAGDEEHENEERRQFTERTTKK